MSDLECQITWFGDRCLRLQFGEGNTPEIRFAVRRAMELIAFGDVEGRFSLAPAYTTILVGFDPLEVDEPESAVRSLLSAPLDHSPASPPASIEIPVCYEGDFAPDLETVAAHSGLSHAEVIRRHSNAAYEVAFVGFTPGFGYLTGLPPELATPRLVTPRTLVPAGSLGIAGEQCGVYPSATPGGWRLIGRTPLRMFDATRDQPSLLAIGDRVRFRPIAHAEFESLASKNTGANR